jgi:hypothetical protein
VSRRADREGVPRARYLDLPSARGVLARSISHRFGVAAFRRCGMHGAARAYLRDLRAYRLENGIGHE